MNRRRRRRTQDGFALICAVIWIGVLGVLLTLLFSGLHLTMQDRALAQVQDYARDAAFSGIERGRALPSGPSPCREDVDPQRHFEVTARSIGTGQWELTSVGTGKGPADRTATYRVRAVLEQRDGRWVTTAWREE